MIALTNKILFQQISLKPLYHASYLQSWVDRYKKTASYTDYQQFFRIFNQDFDSCQLESEFDEECKRYQNVIDEKLFDQIYLGLQSFAIGERNETSIQSAIYFMLTSLLQKQQKVILIQNNIPLTYQADIGLGPRLYVPYLSIALRQDQNYKLFIEKPKDNETTIVEALIQCSFKLASHATSLQKQNCELFGAGTTLDDWTFLKYVQVGDKRTIQLSKNLCIGDLFKEGINKHQLKKVLQRLLGLVEHQRQVYLYEIYD